MRDFGDMRILGQPYQLREWVPTLLSATVGLMSALTFNVVYEDAGEGWVYAHVSELPEVHAGRGSR